MDMLIVAGLLNTNEKAEWQLPRRYRLGTDNMEITKNELRSRVCRRTGLDLVFIMTQFTLE